MNPLKDAGEQDREWCYSHEYPADICPICLAEIEWPAQTEKQKTFPINIKQLEYKAAHLLCDRQPLSDMAKFVMGVAHIHACFLRGKMEPIPEDLL